MDHHNILMLIILVLVEAAAMSTIEYGANNGSNIYIVGILLYLLVGYILYRILITSGLAMTNAKWNVLSIILVTGSKAPFFSASLKQIDKSLRIQSTAKP